MQALRATQPLPPPLPSTAVARKRTQMRSIAIFIVQTRCLRTGRAVARGRTRAPTEQLRVLRVLTLILTLALTGSECGRNAGKWTPGAGAG